ncbi:MAG: hypothetical protein H6699_11080 [Myxococcales bacterium]|nr:hypothetical protein [Myxococcales bacterium]
MPTAPVDQGRAACWRGGSAGADAARADGDERRAPTDRACRGAAWVQHWPPMPDDPSLSIDEELWFLVDHCGEARHYLLGNPYTFTGRMSAWCPTKQCTFCVSKQEISACSPAARAWIAGFLAGCAPPPPTDARGDVDVESAAYRRWCEETARFADTGCWDDGERSCEDCGAELLRSADGERCDDCLRRA